jgi:hypothetical protein
MKQLLIAAIAASLCTPVLAAPPVQKDKTPHQTSRSGPVKPLQQFEETHKAGFYQGTEMRPILKDAAVQTGTHGAAGVAEAGAAVAAPASEVAAAVPAAGSSLGLATPLVGSLTVGAAVGIGAAVVAVGAAVGNHGGGGHSSTTGTTQ